MPMTREIAIKLAELVNLLRPDWDRRGVYENLKPLAGRPAADTCLRAIRAAADPGARTPGVIPSDGPHAHERVSAATAPRGPKPHEECGKHPGQFRLSCSGCSGDRHAGRDDEAKLKPIAQETAADQIRRNLTEQAQTHCTHKVPRDQCADCCDPEPEAEPEITTPSSPGSISPKQLQALHISFGEAGIDDRDDKLDYCQAVIDCHIDTTKDLSRNEASQVIDALKQIKATES